MVSYAHIGQQVKVIATATALPAAIKVCSGKIGTLERIRIRGGRRYCSLRINGNLIENFLPEELAPTQVEALPEAA